ncbi:hypothetical protein D3C84_736170 [compost metagenome]
MHLVELDPSAQGWQSRTRNLRQLAAGIEDIAQALERDAGLLEVGPQLRQAHDGLRHPTGQHIEGDQLANAEFPFDDQARAEPQGRHGHQLADQRYAFIGQHRQGPGPEAGGHVASQLVIPAAVDLRLHRHRLEGVDAVHGLDQERLVLRAPIETVLQACPQRRRDEQGEQEIEG